MPRYTGHSPYQSGSQSDVAYRKGCGHTVEHLAKVMGIDPQSLMEICESDSTTRLSSDAIMLLLTGKPANDYEVALSTKIADLYDLPVRTAAALAMNEIVTVRDLFAAYPHDNDTWDRFRGDQYSYIPHSEHKSRFASLCYRTPNFGTKSMHEMLVAISKLGIPGNYNVQNNAG